MPRIGRIVAPGLPHHIVQRGNYRQNVFNDDADKERYLSYLKEYSKKYGLAILSYCLMKNHVHFVAVPETESSLAKTFNTAHMCYSQYFNKKTNVNGHLWQGRFFSCILDGAHLVNAARYVEQNPVRAGLSKKPWVYKWSSASYNALGKENTISLGNLFDYIEFNRPDWKGFLTKNDSENNIKELQKHTRNGKPLAQASFIKQLEVILGRKIPR